MGELARLGLDAQKVFSGVGACSPRCPEAPPVRSLAACDPPGATDLRVRSGQHDRDDTQPWLYPSRQRLVETVPRCRGKVTTMMGALSLDSMFAMTTVEGGTKSEVFLTFAAAQAHPCAAARRYR